jgi:hypothetical protein
VPDAVVSFLTYLLLNLLDEIYHNTTLLDDAGADLLMATQRLIVCQPPASSLEYTLLV